MFEIESYKGEGLKMTSGEREGVIRNVIDILMNGA